MRTETETCSLAIVLFLPACLATKMVPPPAPPVPIVPAWLTADPPRSASKGRLVLDVAGTRAAAFEIVAAKGDSPDSHALLALCETPCAVNLARGPHRIAFLSAHGFVGQEDVTVGDHPLVVREQLGYVEAHPVPWYAGIGAASLGGLGLLFGLVLAAQGDGETRDPQALRDLRVAGGALIGASAAFLGAGWLLLHIGRTEIQPSAATVFPEPVR